MVECSRSIGHITPVILSPHETWGSSFTNHEETIMSNISKRDFLKTIPAAVPATMLGGLAGGLILPATAHESGGITVSSSATRDKRVNVTRIHIGEAIQYIENAVENGVEWYDDQRNTVIESLCSDLLELNDFSDIPDPYEECQSVLNDIFDAAEETIWLLVFGRFRFLAGALTQGARQFIVFTGSPR